MSKKRIIDSHARPPPPQVEFIAGDGATQLRKSQYTATQKATNSVYWNETKIFQACPLCPGPSEEPTCPT